MNALPHRTQRSRYLPTHCTSATQWPRPHEPNPEPDVPVVPPHEPDEGPLDPHTPAT